MANGFSVRRACFFLCARVCWPGIWLISLGMCVLYHSPFLLLVFAVYQLCFYLVFKDLCSGSITQLISLKFWLYSMV